jgi:hypothetical protein
MGCANVPPTQEFNSGSNFMPSLAVDSSTPSFSSGEGGGGAFSLDARDGGLPGGCDRAGAWVFHDNGTITSDQRNADSKDFSKVLCVAKGDDDKGTGTAVSLSPCTSAAANQRWTFGKADGGTVTLEQNGGCVTNNFFDVPPLL